MTMQSKFPVVAMRDLVVFPGHIAPMFVSREKSIASVVAAIDLNSQIFLMTQKQSDTDTPEETDLYDLGVIAKIIQVLRLPDKTVKILVEGIQRAECLRLVDEGTHLVAYVEGIEQDTTASSPATTLLLLGTIKKLFLDYAQDNIHVSTEIHTNIETTDDLSSLIDLVCAQMTSSADRKQAILKIDSVEKRAEQLIILLQQEMDWMSVERKLNESVRHQISEDQRNYFRREKLKAIKKQLEEDEGHVSEMDELKARIEAKKLPKHAHEKAMEEFRKLEKSSSPLSSETTVMRNYIDTILELPWKTRSKVVQDIHKAEKALHQSHYGLEKVKERILESLAIQMRVKHDRGTVMCLVGPPGVGKTSLGASIAAALGREFVRISLGGVRDEAEIRGHRRTYIGAMPGRILHAMKKAKVTNPVILLDEVDKMGFDVRSGDPASALLEVLDKEQNNAFNDHYLEIGYDLSKVMFLTTANSMDIPEPLRDRMEIIELSGYTEHEKLHIAKDHLIKKQSEDCGLHKNEVVISDNAIMAMIHYYTRESGVRELDRLIQQIYRKIVIRTVRKPKKKRTTTVIKSNQLTQYLGIHRYEYDKKVTEDTIGIVNGLAWTQSGGDLLKIECACFSGKQDLEQTGLLGEVMQESVKTAFSVVKTHAPHWDVEDQFFQKHDFHIHVPGGAIPKDGPSAGISIATALLSACTKRRLRADWAMTGEITLNGDVLAIGGLKEKLLAAQRSGIRHVIIPAENAKDLSELSQEVTKGITVHCVKKVTEVWQHIFLPADPEASGD